MKTNIAGLMSLIKNLEDYLNKLSIEINLHSTNKTIIELDGKENVVEDFKEDFDNEFLEYQKLIARISYLKTILYEKNNEFKLTDGRCIQQAIVDNTNLRKLKSLYDVLLEKRNTKIRVTEVNNSYFESTTLNYDIKKIKEESKKIEDKIMQTDFEISKLNSIEFEIKE